MTFGRQCMAAFAFSLIGCGSGSPQAAQTEYVQEYSDRAAELIPVSETPERHKQNDASPTLDGCPGKAMIMEATPRVRPDDSAPLAPALGRNSWVFVCGQRIDALGWVEIMYSSELSLAECDGHYPIDGSEYAGPCPVGWVREEVLIEQPAI